MRERAVSLVCLMGSHLQRYGEEPLAVIGQMRADQGLELLGSGHGVYLGTRNRRARAAPAA